MKLKSETLNKQTNALHREDSIGASLRIQIDLPILLGSRPDLKTSEEATIYDR